MRGPRFPAASSSVGLPHHDGRHRCHDTAMKRRTRSVLVSLLPAAALGAQSIVSPPAFAHVEAPDSFVVPISPPFPGLRLLQVDANLMGSQRVIHGIRFRRDAYASYATPAAAVVATLRLSLAATTPATVSPTFANNVVSPTVQVFALGLSIPATAPQQLPEPFVLDIPFQTPFAYAGTAPLCWDLEVTASNTPVYVEVDAVLAGNTDPAPAGIRFGTGCTLAGNPQPIELTGAALPNWSGTPATITFRHSAGNLAANSGGYPNPGSVAVLFYGLDRLPTPASACSFLIQPLICDVGLVDAFGALTSPFQLVVPVVPAHNGVDLYAQLLTLDPANLAIAVSDAQQFNIAAPFPPQSIGTGIVSGSVAAPAGNAWPNAGVVVEYY
jgi:hypothetical protein